MKVKFLVILLLAISVISPAFAQSVSAVCTQNDTLVTSAIKLRCINNVCTNLTTNFTVPCQYGCNTKEMPNKCNPSPFQANLIVWSSLVAIIILGWFAAMKFKR